MNSYFPVSLQTGRLLEQAGTISAATSQNAMAPYQPRPVRATQNAHCDLTDAVLSYTGRLLKQAVGTGTATSATGNGGASAGANGSASAGSGGAGGASSSSASTATSVSTAVANSVDSLPGCPQERLVAEALLRCSCCPQL